MGVKIATKRRIHRVPVSDDHARAVGIDRVRIGGFRRFGARCRRVHERIRARGHENVSATHASTFEVTTDDYLTPAGDCILAIEADRAPAGFDPAFVRACRDAGATVTATIRAGGREATVEGRGHPELSFASDRSAVVRTSGYVDDRTVMVRADTAASDLDRDLVAALADGADLTLDLAVHP